MDHVRWAADCIGLVVITLCAHKLRTVACDTCGNPKCSACGRPFTEKPLHVYWYECICKECEGPPLTEEELDALFSK